MKEIKGFDRKQLPVAIGSLLIVIAIIILVLAFAKTGAKKEKATSPEESASTEVTSNTAESTEDSSQTTVPTTTAPATTQPSNEDYAIKSSIIIQGSRAMEMYSVAQKSLTGYADMINTFSYKVPNAQVYFLLAPTSVEFYGPESYRTGNHSQSRGIGIAYSAIANNVKTVDAYSELQKETSDYIYFRTDHHWTARGAYYAYRAFASVAGFTPTELSAHQTGRIEGFVGSMYTYTSADVLKQNPDYVEYFYPISSAEGMIYQDASLTNGRPLRIISEEVKSSNKYLAFLEGDNPIEKIVSSNKNGKKIVVIKESYGNSFAPFLIDNYEEVYVVDPRRCDINLPDFVNNNGITDVLFINYTFVPSNPTYKDALAKMLA